MDRYWLNYITTTLHRRLLFLSQRTTFYERNVKKVQHTWHRHWRWVWLTFLAQLFCPLPVFGSEPISCLALRANLLSSWPFQKSPDGDDQLAQEALDDWPALGKLVLHLNLQHISYQSHKCIFLKKEYIAKCWKILYIYTVVLALHKVNYWLCPVTLPGLPLLSCCRS